MEGYIEGREYAVEGVLTRGELRVLAVFEKPDPLEGPFFEETIYVTPPDLRAEVQHQIAEEVQRATAALRLSHGPIHAECRIGAGGVTMLEVAARPIGGLCSRVLRFEAGRERASLEEVLLRHAVGEDISPYMREAQAAGVMMIPIPRRGRLVDVEGRADALAVPGIVGLEITIPLGRDVVPLPEGDRYLGFLFAKALQPRVVEASLRAAHDALRIVID